MNDVEGVCMTYFKVLSQHLHEETEKNYEQVVLNENHKLQGFLLHKFIGIQICYN
jgi:hypothetical protein